MASSIPEDSMPELKRLSQINGQINQMTKETLCDQLSSLDLDMRGTKDVLKKRLKGYYKRQKLYKNPQSSAGAPRQYYDYFCVIDFEATCQQENTLQFQHEIIEFPAVMLCTHNHQIVEEFHSYCRPIVNPTLTEFCMTLTGITQQQVDDADPFPKILDEFVKWLAKFDLGKKHKMAIVTDGPWDMGRFLYRQCELSGIPFPRFAKKWINIRKIFSNYFRCRRMSLLHMLEFLGMAFDGRQHCGLDDARNIARIVCQLLLDGAEFKVNEFIHVHRSEIQQDSETLTAAEGCQESKETEHGQMQGRLKSAKFKSSNAEMPHSLMNTTVTANCAHKKNATCKQIALSVEEQMENLGVDPSLENSLENIVAGMKFLQTGKR